MRMINYVIIIILSLMTFGCQFAQTQSEKQSNGEEVKIVFGYDYLAPIMASVIDEIAELPIQNEEDNFCKWLNSYKSALADRLVEDGISHKDFEIIGFARLPDNVCYVDSEGHCELVNYSELPIQITNIFEANLACSEPEENRFKPENYSYCFSKIIENQIGYKMLIQICYNRKDENIKSN